MAHKNYTKFSDRFKKAEGEKVVEEIKETIENELQQEIEQLEAVEENKDIIVEGYVTGCEKLNVRDGNSPNAKVLCVLNKNDIVQVNLTVTVENWYKVCTAAGVKGYCMASYILFK